MGRWPPVRSWVPGGPPRSWRGRGRGRGLARLPQDSQERTRRGRGGAGAGCARRDADPGDPCGRIRYQQPQPSPRERSRPRLATGAMWHCDGSMRISATLRRSGTSPAPPLPWREGRPGARHGEHAASVLSRGAHVARTDTTSRQHRLGSPGGLRVRLPVAEVRRLGHECVARPDGGESGLPGVSGGLGLRRGLGWLRRRRRRGRRGGRTGRG